MSTEYSDVLGSALHHYERLGIDLSKDRTVPDLPDTPEVETYPHPDGSITLEETKSMAMIACENPEEVRE
jgi:hypothetical protein